MRSKLFKIVTLAGGCLFALQLGSCDLTGQLSSLINNIFRVA